jgi:multidrug efflux pump subunit AcrA (membrane-fusion protein)
MGGWLVVESPDLSLEELEATFRRRERRALRRTTLLTLVPVVAGAALLWLTLDRLHETNQKLERTQRQLEIVTEQLEEATHARDVARREATRLRAQLKRDRARLQATQRQLRESAKFVGHEHPVTFTDIKGLASTSARAAPLFERIFRQMPVKWGLANTPKEGFTSPGFAGYVLRGLAPVSASSDPEQALLGLRRTTEAPFIGDVVLYDTGFAMFYLRDSDHRPYVMGMTPVGVLALEPDFGVKKVAVLRTGLSTGQSRPRR